MGRTGSEGERRGGRVGLVRPLVVSNHPGAGLDALLETLFAVELLGTCLDQRFLSNHFVPLLDQLDAFPERLLHEALALDAFQQPHLVAELPLFLHQLLAGDVFNGVDREGDTFAAFRIELHIKASDLGQLVADAIKALR